ncbi:hypothetical protein WN944_029396 [Citrus x changshan-huyou]|uniref:Uncharacterized protein n=1 Tax=Citrus x changshan-huyou TaxID=2935761 RepID=A0AAP0LSG2_9ROSI
MKANSRGGRGFPRNNGGRGGVNNFSGGFNGGNGFTGWSSKIEGYCQLQDLTDTGVNAHITPDNGNLVHPRDYNGQDTIAGVVGGSCLPIKSISHSYLSANSSSLF